jgi:cytochrome c oxidase assembly protein subunit 15
MIIIQVLPGGITRPQQVRPFHHRMEAHQAPFPPMTEQDWNFAFEKYQQIAQYKYLNSHFTLADFNSFFLGMVSSSMGKIDWCCIHHSFHHLYCSKKFKKEDDRPLLILLL